MRAEMLSWCRQNGLFAPGERVICAVSGGADSMAMLWCLHCLQSELSVRVEAAHFNHRLRGEESDRDEAFVREFCAAHGIALTVGAAPENACGPSGVEETARRLRYAFFETLDCDRLATAHNANDNAETILLNLLRGTGLRGLCGIPPVRGRIVRPLLFASRQEILEYLRAEGISWVEDSTNTADDCLRNRLRHRVLPLLYEEAPDLPARLTGQSLLLRGEDAYLDRQARLLLAQAQEDEALWRVAPLREAPEVLQRRAIRVLLRAFYPADVAQCHVEAVRALLTADSPSAEVSLPHGLCACRVYEKLTVREAGRTEPFCVPLQIPGCTALPDGRNVRCTIAEFFENSEKSPFQFAIKYAMIKNHMVVARSRQPGDVFHPGEHRTTLKKLMIDRRIPRARRDTLCVFAAAEEIFAVEGIGTDALCRPLVGEPALIIQIEKEEMYHDTRHCARSDHAGAAQDPYRGNGKGTDEGLRR